jgi:hypothetical protein
VNVPTRNPQFKVRFVTAKLGEFDFDTTLTSVVTLTTTKRISDSAGSFTLVLVPRSLSNIPNAGGWQDVVECMDFIEIFLWCPPRRPDIPVMRGFVDTITEDFSIEGGQPQRKIVITGRDYGKLLLLTKLYDPITESEQDFLWNRFIATFQLLFGPEAGNPKAVPLPESPAMPAGATVDGPFFTPVELLKTVFTGFYKPQEEAIKQTFNNLLPSMEFLPQAENDPWESRLKVHSSVFYQRVTVPLTDVWALMVAFALKPWRELFVREGKDFPTLVYRPAMWLDLFGKPVQDYGQEGFAPHPLPNTEISAFRLVRSEELTRNFFFTFPEIFKAYATVVKLYPGTDEGFLTTPRLQSNPFLIGAGGQRTIPVPPQHVPLANVDLSVPVGGVSTEDIPIADFHRFGFRVMEFLVPYMDWERPVKRKVLQEQIKVARENGLELNYRLVEAFSHNHLLEFGTLIVKGDERIQAGMYVALTDHGRQLGGNNPTGPPRYYVEAVSHEFQWGTQANDGHFITHLEVSRGRGHLVRAFERPG